MGKTVTDGGNMTAVMKGIAEEAGHRQGDLCEPGGPGRSRPLWVWAEGGGQQSPQAQKAALVRSTLLLIYEDAVLTSLLSYSSLFLGVPEIPHNPPAQLFHVCLEWEVHVPSLQVGWHRRRLTWGSEVERPQLHRNLPERAAGVTLADSLLFLCGFHGNRLCLVLGQRQGASLFTKRHAGKGALTHAVGCFTHKRVTSPRVTATA